MSDPFVAEIRIFANNFAPRGWAFCNGQLLPIAQNTALFALVGTIYGGDGRTSFGLPDLRGRAALHPGRGPGLSTYRLGENTGTENVALTAAQIPEHTHGMRCNSGDANSQNPVGNFLAKELGPAQAYSPSVPNSSMGADAIGGTGTGQAHNNMQPFLTLNFCIALIGVFPSRG